PEEWQAYHVFRKIRYKEVYPDDPVNPDEMIETARKQEEKDDEGIIERYFVWNNDSKVVGSMYAGILTEKNPSYKGNEHICQFDISLLPEYRRKRFGTQLLKRVIDLADFHDKFSLLASTNEESGKAFLKKFGFPFALSNKQNRLVLNKVDWPMVQQWVDDGIKRNPSTNLLFFNRIPDSIIESFAKIFTETGNQAPLGSLEISDMVLTPEVLRKREKDFQEVNRIPNIAVTVESDGDISGLTEILYEEQTKILLQGLTGVRDKYRGRGLGKWIKAAMLLYVKEHYPEASFIKTGNAESNAPMLSINNRLGFTVFKESIMTQCKLEDLKKNFTLVINN
ncbi:MAG: GNAT family N-acetyltransferase, partial [Candidatus Thorarchaeota archaeon]